MKKLMKKMKVTVSVAVMLMMFFSVTAFAAELNTTPTSDDGEQKVLTDLEKDGNYVIELENPDQVYTYTGKEICPEIKVYLLPEEQKDIVLNPEDVSAQETNEEANKVEVPEECYTVEYKNNINAGAEAFIVVTGTEDEGYTGTISKEFVINVKSIENAKITLSDSDAEYTGKEIKPEETVVVDGITLVEGTDYTVSYADNTEIGTATVTVTGKGNYAGTKKSEYTIRLGVPKLSSTTEYNKVTVNWEKIPGATGYVLQRSTSKDTGYSTIAKITKGSTVKYVDSKVKFNSKYYYRIRAYRTVNGADKYSDYSTVISRQVRPAQVSGVKVARVSYTSLKVSWAKVSGASGYRVYRSTSKDGEYKSVKTVSGSNTLSYTDKNLTCGITYYYKVRAYRTVSGTKYFGSNSEIRYIYTRPQKVGWNTSSITFSSDYVNLKWKKAAGATGYEIYRSTSEDGTYKVVKTLSGASTLSWKNTGLTKGTVYYYKIRAFRKVNGEPVYGPYSAVYKKNVGGWKYSTYDGRKVKLYYNDKGNLVKDVSNIIGKQSSYEVRVNKRSCTITIYAKDGNNGYIIPVKSFICSTGYKTPEGTFYTPKKSRWVELMGPSWGQWTTRLSGSFWFHSVTYRKYRDNNSLNVAAYNKLGTICSHGCIRLVAGDAKWLYQNCKLNTKVIVYNSSKPGPLGKPKAVKLSSWHTWDPTDPDMQYKCKAKGCH